MKLYRPVFDRTYTLSLVRLARRYGALTAFSRSKLFPSVEDNRNRTYCENTTKRHIFTTQRAILVSIKVSANIASPEGMRPEWTVRPGMSSPPPPTPQWSVPRTRLVMEHEMKGTLLKTAQSPDINARGIPLFGPLLTSSNKRSVPRHESSACWG
jgi:hypothetical protein